MAVLRIKGKTPRKGRRFSPERPRVTRLTRRAEKPPISAIEIKPNIPRYWNIFGRIPLNSLKNIAKRGMESVHRQDWG